MNTLIHVSLWLMALSLIPAEAKLYKWVDEDGKVHYSDKVPPDQIKNAREELSEQGVVKDKVSRELTAEEKKAKAEELKQQRELAAQLEQERIAREQEKKKILLSYSSADQIKRLKSERVSALQRNIATATENLEIQDKNLNDLMKRAVDKERSGEVVSDVFLSQIDQIKAQIEYQKEFIKDKTAEIAETEAKYDNELALYMLYTNEDS